MTKHNERDEEALLDAVFEAGKSHAPAPSDSFLARLSLDAEAALPRNEAEHVEPPKVPFFSRFKGLFAASGLSTAAVLGLWIGFVAPDIFTTVSPLSEDTVMLSAFLPGSDLSVLSE